MEWQWTPPKHRYGDTARACYMLRASYRRWINRATRGE